MNRNVLTSSSRQTSNNALSRETAIHEAGHAAAIYLGNQQKQLPPVFFQIVINRKLTDHCFFYNESNTCDEWIAKIEFGRLIHTLPTSTDQVTKEFSVSQKQAYQLAFEADIINLLVGSLAEAKYVALRDDEPFSPYLVPVQALHYYGGASDIKLIHEYLDCLPNVEDSRTNKINELFLKAYQFINTYSNWQAIEALADYIQLSALDRMGYEEVGSIIS